MDLPSSTGDVDGLSLLQVSEALQRVPNGKARKTKDAIVDRERQVLIESSIQVDRLAESLILGEDTVRLPADRSEEGGTDREGWVLGVDNLAKTESSNRRLFVSAREVVLDVYGCIVLKKKCRVLVHYCLCHL